MIVHPNSFLYNNSNNDVLFFDIFYKNNVIFCILPIYNTPLNPNLIRLFVNDKAVHLGEQILKDAYEPIMILKYPYVSTDATINLRVVFGSMTKTFSLDHIHSTPKQLLSITTLFKDDVSVFPLFYDYYRKQGVDHFFIYYNGIVTPEISSILDKECVTLIEWNFRYWNPDTYKYYHHAQLGSIHDGLYKFCKDDYDYTIICDFDEYIHIPKQTIRNYILQNPDVDTFGFHNRWASTLDTKIPSCFPADILATTCVKYPLRGKNIHKTSSVVTIGIHNGYQYVRKPKVQVEHSFFHFYLFNTCRTVTVDMPFTPVSVESGDLP